MSETYLREGREGISLFGKDLHNSIANYESPAYSPSHCPAWTSQGEDAHETTINPDRSTAPLSPLGLVAKLAPPNVPLLQSM